MRAKKMALVFLLMIFCMIFAVDLLAFTPVYVYSEKRAENNNYAPSGWMGDYSAIKFSDGWPKNTYAGATCIKITYDAAKSRTEKWAGIYWQDPPNNWGSAKGGLDLTGAKKLVFAIRGEKGGEVINDIFLGGIKGQYADSCSVAIGPIELTTQWETYEIDLTGKDLSHIIGGFGWSTNLSANPDGCTFYLDEIRYE